MTPELDKLIAAEVENIEKVIFFVPREKEMITAGFRSFAEKLRAAVELDSNVSWNETGKKYDGWNAALASVKANWDKLLNS